MNLYNEIQFRLMNLKVGDKLGGFQLTSRSPKRITMHDSEGRKFIISIKSGEGFVYLDSKKLGWILREIEGYEIMKIHSTSELSIF